MIVCMSTISLGLCSNSRIGSTAALFNGADHTIRRAGLACKAAIASSRIRFNMQVMQNAQGSVDPHALTQQFFLYGLDIDILHGRIGL